MYFDNTILKITFKHLVKLVKSIVYLCLDNFSINLPFWVQITKKKKKRLYYAIKVALPFGIQ